MRSGGSLAPTEHGNRRKKVTAGRDRHPHSLQDREPSMPLPIPLPSQEMLCRLLRYEPETGLVFWRHRSDDLFAAPWHASRWNNRHAGQRAFPCKQSAGYYQGGIFGKDYLLHRVIWKMVTGDEPDLIDHDDRDRANNQWVNLKSTTHQGNSKNRGMSSANTSGYVGVTFIHQRQKWRSNITLGGRNVHLGYFDRIEHAVAARRAANLEHNFHPNHGKSPA
jgi:hypothetical protein